MPDAAFGDWTVDAQAALRHDSNIVNAASAADVVGDSIVNARLSLLDFFALGENYSLTVGGDLGGEVHRTITGLSNASVEGVLSLKRKWGLGAFAPWARVGLVLGRSSYDDSYRNATDYRATTAVGWRIDARWNIWADYGFDHLAAAAQEEEVPGISGDAYSQISNNLAAHVEYSLNERTYLAFALRGREGDVVSTTSEENPQIQSAARAIAEDPAFGPEAYAYRISGSTYGAMLGINYSPTPHSLLGCGFERLITHAYGGANYTKSIPDITWDFRF
jgi:hypothetical protein